MKKETLQIFKLGMLPPGSGNMAPPYSPSNKAQVINMCFREKINILHFHPPFKKFL